jgi:hypothetical protein
MEISSERKKGREVRKKDIAQYHLYRVGLNTAYTQLPEKYTERMIAIR